MVVRKLSDSRTMRGSFRGGKLDFGSERYLIRQSGRDIRLTRENNRDDTVLLRRQEGRPTSTGEDLTITEPRNNDRIPSGVVFIRGESRFPDVQIELRRGRDVIQSASLRSHGREYEFRFNLTPGKYEATVRAKDRDRMTVERKLVFNVGGMGKTYIERPAAGEKLRSGPVEISGTSEAPEVEVEIYRGRDRVFIEQSRVRDGRFVCRTKLDWGTYVVTVRSKEDGKVLGTDKRGFEVVGNDGLSGRDLRLDKPSDRGRYRGSSLDFDGTAGGLQVRVQVFRGRDRIENQLVDVRDGRFHVRVRLSPGHYDATIMSEDHGRVITTKRMSFDVE
ncbi:MAG TPA: hypothetical protein VHE55_15020 [Fimbriimonadaceae bacterium]|nr:hypothetical protein [Fimbriimonadaceae bacterium]